MPMVAGTGETTTTMMKRGMKPFIHGVPITTTAAAAAASTAPPHPPPEQEHLPCPRCDSTNTKFCYYNNYNFSQPRHFCKSCRRYWTHGGTLRDIPVGGGTRKTAKRCRTSITTTSTPTPNTSSSSSPAADIPVCSSAGGGGDQVGKANFFWAMGGPFTSLLSNPGPGLGFVPGIEDVGFGLGRGFWPLQVVEDGSGGGNHTGGGGAVGMGGITGGNPWQFESGESGFGSDCLSWPDLSISTLGNGLK